MLVTLIANNWFINILAAFFISLLDTVAYTLLAGGYNVFYAVSQIDIFATDGGETIYTEITSKIYTALSVVMVFVFAYYLIMMIIDPDGGKGKSTTALVKETIIAFITVILLPTVFKYMSLFQTHVISNNTIGNLVLGGSGGNNGDYGDQVAMIVFTSFYHPEGTSYSDYFDNDGNFLKDTAMGTCTNGGANDDICEVWVAALEEWTANKALTAVGPISRKSKLYNATNDEGGMYYMWIITTVCGVVCAWFFFSYAIDVGTRCVKLAFLQLVSPIPVLLKIFPQGKKTFDAWFAEIKKSYLEIFLRLAIIFFIIKLCTMVPMFIDFSFSRGFGGAIGDSTNSITSNNVFTRALATVCLILGLLKFAKDAPQLFKTIFASGGGLFAGLDWKPGMKRRVSENEYAMKGLGGAVGLAAGGVGAAVMAGRKAYNENAPEGDVGTDKAWAAALGAGIRGLGHGAISGARNGFKNAPTEFSGKGIANAANAGVSAGQAAEVKAANNREQYGGFLHPLQSIDKHATEFSENIVEGWHNIGSTLSGGKLNNAAVDTIKKATDNMDAVIKLKDVTNIDNAMKKLEEDIRTKGFVKYGDKYYSLNGDSIDVGDGKSNVENHRARYGDKATNADGHYFNPAIGDYDHNYNPNTDRTFSSKKMVNTEKLGDLKTLFNQQKNQELAEAINKNYHEGASTYMANVAKQLSKELGNLGTENIAKINAEIKKGGLKFKDSQNNIRDVENINDFLTKMSNVKENVTAEDIKVLKDVKSKMSDISKNIVIAQQAQAAGKQQEKKDGK